MNVPSADERGAMFFIVEHKGEPTVVMIGPRAGLNRSRNRRGEP